MGRLQRQFVTTETYFHTTAIGATNGSASADILAPAGGARIIRWDATLQTSAADTGTFTCLIEETGGTDLSAAVTIDVDAATNTTVQGLGNGTAVTADGVRLALLTTKTGTVATGNKLLLNIVWQM